MPSHAGDAHPALTAAHHRPAEEVEGGCAKLHRALDAPGEDDAHDDAGGDVETNPLLGGGHEQPYHDRADDDAHKCLQQQIDELTQIRAHKRLGVDEKSEQHGEGNAHVKEQCHPCQREAQEMFGDGGRNSDQSKEQPFNSITG